MSILVFSLTWSVDWSEIYHTQHITGNFTVKAQIYQSEYTIVSAVN